METADFDRSTLERKDRAQLAALAEALGQKAPSRARKGEIVDLILELAGVSSPTSGGSERSGSGSNGSAGGSVADSANGSSDGAPSDAGRQERPGGAAGGSSRTLSFGSGGASASTGSDTSDGSDTTSDDSSDADGTSDRSATDGNATDRKTDGSRGGSTTGRSEGDADDSAESEAAEAGANRSGTSGSAKAGGDSAGSDATPGGQNKNQGRKNNQNQNQNRNNQNQNRNNQNNQNNQNEDGSGRRRRRRRKDRERHQEATADQPWDGETVDVAGLIDLRDDGYGFLRIKGYLPSRDDAYMSVKLCKQYGLRRGDQIEATSRPATRNEKNPAVLSIKSVNGQDPELAKKRPRFEDLTPLFPDQKLRLEDLTQPLDMTSRIIDLISPIGKGQRGLIVSPPKAGKTTVMKTVATSIERNNPEVHLMVLLVDERPEEVTDMRRSVRGEVIASTFDRPSDEHTAVAELTIERAKRLVEEGRDVVIILDGITRLARAYNLAAPATGRIMSGGIDTGALYPPKRFFGAARNVEEGGSLTILATALVETGSKMDEVIFEEFKGTGNMELRLDRRMAEKRVYPAIDVDASSTRHEELLFERSQLNQVWKLRRVLSGLAADGSAGAGLELLIDRMKTFPSNDEFLAEIAKAPG